MTSHDDMNDDDELSRTLAALRVNESQDSFMSSLHVRLVSAGAPQPQVWSARLAAWLAAHPAFGWPALGAATGVAAFSILFVVVPKISSNAVPRQTDRGHVMAQQLRPAATVAQFSVPSEKVALIKMNFTAEVAVQDVTFEVALPPGLVFWSGGEALAEQVFRWPGTLEAGDNVVPVAVRGTKPGLYRVKAKAQVLDQVIEHEVVLEVTEST